MIKSEIPAKPREFFFVFFVKWNTEFAIASHNSKGGRKVIIDNDTKL